jgi:Tfp pilus assembly protein PilF
LKSEARKRKTYTRSHRRRRPRTYRSNPYASEAFDVPPGHENTAISSHYDRGLEHLRARKALLAIRELKQAIRESPDHAIAHRALGKAYAMLGRNDAAFAAFERYVKLAPHAKDTAKLRALIDAYRAGQR